jgi:uncharacterized heparinase superfamily protein
LSAPGRYLRTLWYLRPKQVAARAWFRLYRPRPDLRVTPAKRRVSGRYVEPVASLPSLLDSTRFRFLGVERRCAVAADWRPPGVDKLWTYNLHYFDDLNAEGASERSSWHRPLLTRWVTENPPGEAEGWEPYPVSRRIVNWVKWSLRGERLPDACHESLAVQARWLSRRLEFHLLGNHLLSNAKALLHAGMYYDAPEAEDWRERGRAILERELTEQVLADGGQFERSPMYHAGTLEDFLDLINLLRAYGEAPPAHWSDCVMRMRRWLTVMTHPDGEIAFFNDAAFGMAPRPADLHAYAMRLGFEPLSPLREPLVILEPSGYVAARAGPAYLLCDCAPLGPDYQLGHAHADTLSFEMSLNTQRLFVNSGTSRYGTDSERQRQRGTAAHNTVVVNDRDSSEVWSGFRVGRRARARLQSASQTPERILIAASHDGYRDLPGHNQHTRQWSLTAQALRIDDSLTGAYRRAEARFHLHPEVSVRAGGAQQLLLCTPAGSGASMTFEHADAVDVRPTTWHPFFGVEVASQCVIARFGGGKLTTCVTWDARG